MKKKYKKFSIATLIGLLLIMNFISAFGIGAAYHKDNPLKLSPGQTVDITASLQNMAGNENVTLKGRILKGSEIIKITDSSDIYFIPLGGEKIVNFRVSIPDSAKPGDIYNVELEFATVIGSEKGTFSLGSSVGRKFDVIVIPKPSEEPSQEIPLQKEKGVKNLALILVVLVIIILIVIIFLVNKKRNSAFIKNKSRR